MSDDEVGYKNPPQSSQFRPGVSGNPNGRPKRKTPALAETIGQVLNEKIEFRLGGRTRSASAHELSLKMLVDRAVNGDIGAADLMLKILERAERHGDAGVMQIEIRDWLPDYPGQSGEQKARELAASRKGHAADKPEGGAAEE